MIDLTSMTNILNSEIHKIMIRETGLEKNGALRSLFDRVTVREAQWREMCREWMLYEEFNEKGNNRGLSE